MIWVLVGVAGYVPWPRGIAWLHCFPYLCRLRTVRCMDPGQVTNLLSRAHTCLWEQEGLILSCHGFRLFPDQLLEAGIGGGLSTTLRPGLKCGSLESKFGRGPGTRDRSEIGWSRLCLGCKQDMCFLGYPAEHIDSRITVSA
jgi:hypothetical protein